MSGWGLKTGLGCWLLALCGSLHAADSVGEAIETEAQIRQAEELRREEALRQEARMAPATRTASPDAVVRGVVPNESPCFEVLDIQLVGADAHRFQWMATDVARFSQKCLGAKSIEHLVLNLNDRLVQQGFITSRIYALPQNLQSGVLQLQLSTGRINKITTQEAASQAHGNPDQTRAARSAAMVLPGGVGQLLNVRDLDQAVENFQRLPDHRLGILIEPGDVPLTSDLVLDWQYPKKPWSATLTLDNSAPRSMGRTRLSAQVMWNDPTGLADQLMLHTGSNAEHPAPDHRSASSMVRYTLPWGYHRFSYLVSSSQSGQRVAATTTDFQVRSGDRERQFEWQWTFYRDNQFRWSTEAAWGKRYGRTYIEDSEQIVPRRHARFRRAGVSVNWQGVDSSAQVSLHHEQVVRRMGEDEVIFRLAEEPKAVNIRLSGYFSTVFQAWQRRWRYSAQWDNLSTQKVHPLGDAFSLGGRHSIRGFTGDHPIVASDGARLRQDLYGEVFSGGCQTCYWTPYMGLDIGRLSGPISDGGKRLLGGVAVGVQFANGALSADLALTMPLCSPHEKERVGVVPYVSLSWSL